MPITRGKMRSGEVGDGKWGINGDRRETWVDEHTIQYTDDLLQGCTPETYIILLTIVTSINSI